MCVNSRVSDLTCRYSRGDMLPVRKSVVRAPLLGADVVFINWLPPVKASAAAGGPAAAPGGDGGRRPVIVAELLLLAGRTGQLWAKGCSHGSEGQVRGMRKFAMSSQGKAGESS